MKYLTCSCQEIPRQTDIHPSNQVVDYDGRIFAGRDKDALAACKFICPDECDLLSLNSTDLVEATDPLG